MINGEYQIYPLHRTDLLIDKSEKTSLSTIEKKEGDSVDKE